MDKTLDIDINSPYINILRKSNLCQWFYLRGRCEGCDRNHAVAPLNERAFDYLWYLARQGFCFRVRRGKKECDDPKCVYGHEQGCPLGSGRP